MSGSEPKGGAKGGKGEDSQSGIRSAPPIKAGNRALRKARKEYDPDNVVVALSGGHDSAAALKFAVESSEIAVTRAIHIDTGVGLNMTKEYAEEICNRWGVDLTILGDHNARYPHESYEHLVKQFGFPGSHPLAHRGTWQNLKNKPRSRFESSLDGSSIFISGVRKYESEKRMENIPDGGVGEVNGTTWVSPLFEFTDSDLEKYFSKHNIPRNESYKILHASGECLCGSYADRRNLPFIRTVEPETAKQIDRLEFEAITLAARGEMPVERALWANGSLSTASYKARTDDKQTGITCVNCENSCPDGPYDRQTGEHLSPAEQFLSETDLTEFWNRDFYCAPCDEVVEDPLTHRREVHPFEKSDSDGLAGEWDLRMVDCGASMEYGEPITEPNGWNLHVNQLTPDESEAAISKHRYYYDDYELELCHRQEYTDKEHQWVTYNGGPTLVCKNCGSFNLKNHDLENSGPPAVDPEPNVAPDFEEVATGQHTLSQFKKKPCNAES